MRGEVVGRERALDRREAVGVEGLQDRQVLGRLGVVVARVGDERQRRVRLPDRPDGLDVPPGADVQGDAGVARSTALLTRPVIVSSACSGVIRAPVTMDVRVPPSACASGMPRVRHHRSQQAVSTAAAASFAPRSAAADTSSGRSQSRPIRAGAIRRSMSAQAAPAPPSRTAISPQPTAPPPVSRTSTLSGRRPRGIATWKASQPWIRGTLTRPFAEVVSP